MSKKKAMKPTEKNIEKKKKELKEKLEKLGTPIDENQFEAWDKERKKLKKKVDELEKLREKKKKDE